MRQQREEPENTLIRRILRQCNQGSARLFRNNTGMGWIGAPVIHGSGQSITLYKGDVLVRNARPLRAGLCKGGSDLIGIRRVAINEAMVGQSLGQFLALEAKTKHLRKTEEQKRFIGFIRDFGGLAEVVRSEDEAFNLVRSDD